MESKKEIRNIAFEMRVSNKTEGPVIEGYAAVFDARSEYMGFYEIVRPGAFKESIEADADVKAVIEHQGGLLTLGRTKNRTLKLSEDSKGLHVEINPPATQAGRDAVELLRRGDIDQMSFSFTTIEDRWHSEDGEPVRELLRVELHDVAIVSNPAYPATTVGLRSIGEVAQDGASRLYQRGTLDMKYHELELMEL